MKNFSPYFIILELKNLWWLFCRSPKIINGFLLVYMLGSFSTNNNCRRCSFVSHFFLSLYFETEGVLASRERVY